MITMMMMKRMLSGSVVSDLLLPHGRPPGSVVLEILQASTGAGCRFPLRVILPTQG